jgi:sulfite oxidase
VRDIPGEAPWGPGATGTATWHGVALADVMAAAAPHPAAAHVGLAGRDVSEEAQPPQRYGASIPRRKAAGPEVLLAWAMNGEPLPVVHGGPLRVVVPGYIGARSVKWLERIVLREEPWDGFFQATAYRLLPPEGVPAPGAGVALGEVALNSAILAPEDGAEVAAGPLEVRGYAFAGGGRSVARVDVSTDAGRTWVQADLLEDLGRWAWRMWRARVRLAAGEHELAVRAWDSAAASQPEHPGPLWNPKGYVNNAWSRVSVRAGA